MELLGFLLQLLQLTLLVLPASLSPPRGDGDPEALAELRKLGEAVEALKLERIGLKNTMDKTERELEALQDAPKVAFAASLGGNGPVKTTSGNKNLVYRDVLTNVGEAYNPETGVFTAPVRGVYYIRFTANGPTDFTLSSVLYKNDREIQLIAHEQPSGEGSDTASNGAALLLEKGDTLRMVLWHNTHIWDNSNHHSTFSGFLLYTMESEEPAEQEGNLQAELKKLKATVTELQEENIALAGRLQAAETMLKEHKEIPKVAFAVSLGGNGLVKSTFGNKKLIYRDVLTNVGSAYNTETGVFTAPVRGVYYIRFTANGPTDFTLSSVLYKNDREIQLIAHEQPSGEGSDTASNGAALLLEKGDTLTMYLWPNTQIWDNSNHHSTFSGFLLYTM